MKDPNCLYLKQWNQKVCTYETFAGIIVACASINCPLKLPPNKPTNKKNDTMKKHVAETLRVKPFKVT